MALLQANVSGLPISKDEKGSLNEPATSNIVANNALLSSTTPLNTSPDTNLETFSSGETSIYVSKAGDTVSGVADLFDISVDTILAANDLKKGAQLKAGDILLILPFSGIEHTITKGQTLKGIASLYKIDLSEILLANDIDIDTELIVGEKLIIPGAEIQNEAIAIKPKPKKTTLAIKNKDTQTSLPSVSDYFKLPVIGARRSRGVSPGHHGVDLAAATGTAIHAAAAGKVLVARTGYNGGFGNMVILQHSNGTKTLYAHMSKVETNPGETVSQGETIGLVGSTGHSTGPHLHIEVLGAKNPF